ncbi:MAG: TAT-variant-translocated molybdopterin oxidoreductase [Planctomycetota bacterium]|nr:TAT-variant-translocated molybdopterin oxidoreductase [Planctomycetota bacterium]
MNDKPNNVEARPAKDYWRTLEERADAADFQRCALDEFAPSVLSNGEGVSRRSFLKVVGASAAIAGMTTAAGCKRKTDETIVPYVSQPEGITPGKPLYFATAMTLGGYAQGILAQSHEGRPTKLEGNPDHPATLGASDVFMQGALLGLYDPDRSKVVSHAGTISDWDSFIRETRPRLAAKENNGAGLALLTETITSPTLLDQISAMKKKYPGARWYVHDPIGRHNIRAGLQQATGNNILPIYDFAKAHVIVSLDCDFLQEEPGHLRYARDFADGRRIRAGTTSMNRLYVIESTHTITGTMADHRWAMRPSQIQQAAEQLAAAVTNPATANLPAWAVAIARDLHTNWGQSLVLAGAHQPPHMHSLVHAINKALGNIDKAVRYSSPVEGEPDGFLSDLSAEMDHGAIDFLMILGGNPSYTAPADLQFDARLEAFSKAMNSDGTLRNVTARLGLYDDETSFKCQWHLPQTHFLEEWSDARAYDGTASITQPLIYPLYTGKSMIEVMHIVLQTELHPGYDIVQGFWRGQNTDAPDFDSQWARALEHGTMPIATDLKSRMPSSTMKLPVQESFSATESDFELAFRPDPSVWDGSFTNNGWLQELPRPLTKLVWDNAAFISPASAAKLGAATGDMLKITTITGAMDVPALILPGQPDQTITLHLGYGRWRAGSVGTAVGFNAYQLRASSNPWFTSAQVSRTGQTHELVRTHTHQTIASRHLDGPYPIDAEVIDRPGDDSLDNRKLVRVGTLAQFIADPRFAKKMDESERFPLTLYPGYENIYKQNLSWGMSIDTNSCIGCNACVIACQAENNIPVVGKDQVSRQREMHWIRIDTYYEGSEESPSGAFHQPVPCMQCENAPCELVCPVGATVHDNEGINDMVYNRCVGTRYCSNNCPYKVRRFNFLSYTDYTTESLKLAHNPEVTVRSRGVMEKCTYCIQRVTATRIEMEKLQVQFDEEAKTAAPEDAAILRRKSAELRQAILSNLQTACQQACPSKAIVFGNLNTAVDPIHEFKPEYASDVKSLKDHPLDYSLLADLTTRPRTTYLARIQNPNPALAIATQEHAG